MSAFVKTPKTVKDDGGRIHRRQKKGHTWQTSTAVSLNRILDKKINKRHCWWKLNKVFDFNAGFIYASFVLFCFLENCIEPTDENLLVEDGKELEKCNTILTIGEFRMWVILRGKPGSPTYFLKRFLQLFQNTDK